MARVVEAVYEDGVLKPLEKLDLRDGQRVRIMIVEKYFVQVAREIRMRLRRELRGRDLVEELVRERERFGWMARRRAEDSAARRARRKDPRGSRAHSLAFLLPSHAMLVPWSTRSCED